MKPSDKFISSIASSLRERGIILCVVGTTATGKSELAVELARLLDGEVISLDSMQVYRGMDIGTAKMSRDKMKGVPHHLISVVEPERSFSAGEFSDMADDAVGEIQSRERIPIVVGGTGLYLQAWLHGLFPTPARSEVIRQRMNLLERKDGLKALHRMLTRIDPESGSLIPASDRQRVNRALEIFLKTGRPVSFHRTETGFEKERYQVLKIGLEFNSREDLYETINRRVEKMIENGWIEEVKGLIERCSPESHPFKALGYRELARYLEGGISLEDAKEKIKRSTRNYAKRQITWFKRESRIKWFDTGRDKSLVFKDVLDYIDSSIKINEG